MTPAIDTLPAIRTSSEAVRAEDFMPLMTIDQAVSRKAQINSFIAKVLKEGIDGDYSKLPGGRDTKILLKPGAEKLCSIFGFAPRYVKEVIVEDWTGAEHGGEPLFSYEYRCQLYRGDKFMGESIGSCNSWESKYRYRWIPEDQAKLRGDFDNLQKRGGQRTLFEPDFALDKAETTGKYGKPAEYWHRFREAAEAGTAKRARKKMGTKEFVGYEMTVDETQYRVPNPDAADIINTCQKIAQKRALVAVVLVVTNCSDAFTQDLEDYIDIPTQTAQPEPEDKPIVVTLASGRQVPEELTAMLHRIAHDPKHFGTVCSLMESQMQARAGNEGLEGYDRVVDQFDAKYEALKRNATPQELQETVMDLWEAMNKLPEHPDVTAKK